jgi:hypothetical protein
VAIQCLILRFLRIFAAIQPKCLSMNHLHPKSSAAQSGPIKPNQVIFVFHVPPPTVHSANPPILPIRNPQSAIRNSKAPRSNPVKPSQTQSNHFFHFDRDQQPPNLEENVLGIRASRRQTMPQNPDAPNACQNAALMHIVPL